MKIKFNSSTFIFKGGALQSLSENDINLANGVLIKEVRIDKMEKNYRKTHILRLNDGACTGDAGILYV
ncbi:MAG: hypothetical protein K6T88_11355, partial [Bacillus sp. (in: Bacteria)]|nr:hypothetical protein [Bacillus sp. (in: firmicutes)]